LSLDAGAPGSIPDKISEFILASASMPLLFSPVDIYGHRFMDGGLRDVAPLSSAFKEAKLAEAQHREIWVISTAPALLPYRNPSALDSGKEIIGRGLEIMVHEILENDIQLATELNEAARVVPDYIHVEVRHIRPPSALELDALEFDKPAKRRRAREMGSKAMEAHLGGA
jgi:NTE family protein